MFRRFGVALLGVHAAIHLLGTVVYWKLAEPEGMTYRTELHGGLTLGDVGAVAFGGAWLVAAVLIAGGAIGLHLGWRPWRVVVSGGLALSLVLTALVWPDAGWGAVLDVLLLPAVLVRYRAGVARHGKMEDELRDPAGPGGRQGAEWTHGSVYGRL